MTMVNGRTPGLRRDAEEAVMGFTEAISLVVQTIEALAVGILAVGVIAVLGRAIVELLGRRSRDGIYQNIREGLGRVLLLGLEVLIAADIIATVALELTLSSAASLALIVLIRTFLSWSIEMESEGRWPWQVAAARESNRGNDREDDRGSGPEAQAKRP